MANPEEIRRLEGRIADLKSQLRKLETLRDLLMDDDVAAALAAGDQVGTEPLPSPVARDEVAERKAAPKPRGRTAFEQLRNVLGERRNEPITFTQLRELGVKEASARTTAYQTRAESFVLKKNIDGQGRTGVRLSDEEYAKWRAEMEPET